MIVLTLIIIVFDLLPRYTDIAYYLFRNIENEKLREEVAESEILLQNLKSTNYDLKNRLETIVTDYDKHNQVSNILTLFNTMSKKSKVSILTMKPSTVKKENHLYKQNVILKVSSKYENLYNFLRFAENSNKVFLLKSMTILSDKKVSDSLETELLFEIYLNL